METAPTEAPVFMSRLRFAQTILCCYNNSARGQGRRKTAVRCGVRSHIPPWTSRLCYCEQFNIQTRNKSLNIIWPLLTKNMNIPTIYPCFLSPRTGHWYRLRVVQSAPNLTRAKWSRSLPREGQNLVLRIGDLASILCQNVCAMIFKFHGSGNQMIPSGLLC